MLSWRPGRIHLINIEKYWAAPISMVYRCTTVVYRCTTVVYRCTYVVHRCTTVVHRCSTVVYRCVTLYPMSNDEKRERKTRTPMPLVIDFICCFSHCLYLLYNVLGLLLNFGSHVFAILYYYCITKSYFVHIKHKTDFWIPFKNICFPASIHFSCL